MPLKIEGLNTVIAALTADIATAWEPDTLYRLSSSELETPTNTDTLPVTWLILEPSTWDSEIDGMGGAGFRARFVIRGRFAKPTGAMLSDLKNQKTQALLDLLTAGRGTYSIGNWFPEEVEYSIMPEGSDAAQAFYEVQIRFPVHLPTDL